MDLKVQEGLGWGWGRGGWGLRRGVSEMRLRKEASLWESQLVVCVDETELKLCEEEEDDDAMMMIGIAKQTEMTHSRKRRRVRWWITGLNQTQPNKNSIEPKPNQTKLNCKRL